MPQKTEFDTIYREYYPKAYRLCLGYASGDEEWAEETAQEVFITVWEKLHQLKEKKALSSWIYRITINTCMKRLNEKKKHPTNLYELPETAYYPEAKTEASETLNLVYKAIEKLSIPEKNLAMLLLEGIENEDLADILGISRVNLRVRIYRVREKLKKLMKNE